MDQSFLIMIRNYLWTFLLGSLLCLSACTTKVVKEEKKSVNTPEKVARQWQKFIDENEFEEAKKLATSSAIEWIDGVELIVENAEEGEEITSTTEFTVMTCKEYGDTAICNYVYHEEEEIILDSFFLLRQQGQWLVDIQEIEEEDMNFELKLESDK